MLHHNTHHVIDGRHDVSATPVVHDGLNHLNKEASMAGLAVQLSGEKRRQRVSHHRHHLRWRRHRRLLWHLHECSTGLRRCRRRCGLEDWTLVDAAGDELQARHVRRLDGDGELGGQIVEAVPAAEADLVEAEIDMAVTIAKPQALERLDHLRDALPQEGLNVHVGFREIGQSHVPF
jgi:hypothetical protein